MAAAVSVEATKQNVFDFWGVTKKNQARGHAASDASRDRGATAKEA